MHSQRYQVQRICLALASEARLWYESVVDCFMVLFIFCSHV